MTTMNVPQNQIDKYHKMGFKIVHEEGGAGEWGTDKLKNKYKKDTPGENNEAKSWAQQAAIAIAKKKSGKYDDEGKRIKEGDAMDAVKQRHTSEKEALKTKHDREMDAARLRDTRVKNRTTNANEEFEALFNKDLNESFEMAVSSGVGITLFASDLGIKTNSAFALHPSVVEEEEEDNDDI